jgi:adenosylcobinamide amidohydrolase
VSPERLSGYAAFERTEDHVHVELGERLPVLSSAVLNGGLVVADHLVNLKVGDEDDRHDDPEAALARYCADAGWTGTCVGLMTAAPMSSLRVRRESVGGVEVVVLLTCGLSNPRRAGDAADVREIGEPARTPGTINTFVLTTARLTPPAMAETLAVATEGKSAALQDAAVLSPVSGGVATGTGTDSIAVVGGRGPVNVRYAGKHVRFGEVVGRLVRDALTASMEEGGT